MSEDLQEWAEKAARDEGLEPPESELDRAYVRTVLDHAGDVKRFLEGAIQALSALHPPVSVSPLVVSAEVPMPVQRLLEGRPDLLHLYADFLILAGQRFAALGICGIFVEPASAAGVSSVLGLALVLTAVNATLGAGRFLVLRRLFS